MNLSGFGVDIALIRAEDSSWTEGTLATLSSSSFPACVEVVAGDVN